MASPTVVAIAATKGGVGKSTVAARLALALCAQGYTTLLIDCAPQSPSQDLFFGIAEDALFDFCDVALGRVEADAALFSVTEQKNLFVCRAPYRYTPGTLELCAFRDAVCAMADAANARYVLLDLPNDTGELFCHAAQTADRAMIVSTLHKTALRMAEQTNLTLRDLGVPTRHLLLNGVPLHDRYQPLTYPLLEAIDTCAAPLLGVIPYDASLCAAQDAECVSAPCRADTQTAFANVAKRLAGANVPLFTRFHHLSRRQVLKKKP